MTRLTRQHFQLIANVLADARQDRGSTVPRQHRVQVIEDLSRFFASTLRRTNPAFDSGRFLKACGTEETGE